MKRLTRRAFLAGGTAAATVAIASANRAFATQSASSSAVSTKQSSANVLNLYTSRHYDSDDSLYEGFTALTGIRVNLIEAEADPLIERIKSEGANSPADVLMTVDAGRLWRAQNENLFAPIRSTVLESTIPENFREPNGHWFGFSKRARVLVYNKSMVNPATLSTYEDLANPKWRGQILTRSSSNVYSQSLISSLIEAHGLEATETWARALVANLARLPEGNDTAQIKACAAGQGGIAIANHYYVIRLQASETPEDRAIAEQVGIFFPNQRDRGAHVNISGAGVVKTAPHPEAARSFLEYLTSLEAQAVFAQGNFEYPIVEAATKDSALERLGAFKSDTMSAVVFGENSSEATRLADRVGWP
jgi:iron(III) transport system substrate-binding protein